MKPERSTEERILAMLPKRERNARLNRSRAQHMNAVEAMHKAAQRQ